MRGNIFHAEEGRVNPPPTLALTRYAIFEIGHTKAAFGFGVSHCTEIMAVGDLRRNRGIVLI